MHASLMVIREEHRALAAVLHGLEHLVKQIARDRVAPDFGLLDAMIGYIMAFPIRLHHPKEDQHLFRALRLRSVEVAPILDALEAEHLKDRQYAVAMQEALRRYQGTPGEFSAFASALEQYAAFQWAHMRKEEELVLPVAERVLKPEDWTSIDEAFASNRDPLTGVSTSEEFRDLFRRIMSAAPAPIGLRGS